MVVCGLNYRKLREASSQTMLNSDKAMIKNCIENVNNESTTGRDLLLSIYTEITLTFRDQEQHRKIKPQFGKQLSDVFKQFAFLSKGSKAILKKMVENTLGEYCDRMKITPDTCVQENLLIDLAVHFWVVMITMKDNQLLHVFKKLIEKPKQFKGSFLPSMPQDDVKHFHDFLKIADSGREAYVMYECPNGHPYFIGDCGKPSVTAKCPTCHEEIGGTNHNLVSSNKQIENYEEKPSTGHNLGDPSQRSKQPLPERNLPPASVATIRILTHVALYLGCNNSPKECSSLVEPNISEDNVSSYMWGHLEIDLEVLSQAINMNKEDTVLFLHILLHRIFIDDTNGMFQLAFIYILIFYDSNSSCDNKCYFCL
jgi:hypothetical protein